MKVLPFHEQYATVAVPKLMEQLGERNRLAVPKVTKVVVNVGLGRAIRDEKLFEVAEKTLSRISGQKPVRTLAKQSIAAFKIRRGMPIGLAVTLRGRRMSDFLTKLIHVALPRVRDFRGLSPSAVDASGNLSIGFSEHIAFPEIRSDEVEHIHGLQVVITTTAKDRKKGLALLRTLGFPFREA